MCGARCLIGQGLVWVTRVIQLIQVGYQSVAGQQDEDLLEGVSGVGCVLFGLGYCRVQASVRRHLAAQSYHQRLWLGVLQLAHLGGHVHRVIRRAKGRQFHSDLPVSVATNKDEDFGLPSLRREQVGKRVSAIGELILRCTSNSFVGMKSLDRQSSGVSKERDDRADCLKRKF